MSGRQSAAREHGAWRKIVFDEDQAKLELFMGGSTGELLITASDGNALRPRKIVTVKLSAEDRQQLTRWLTEGT